MEYWDGYGTAADHDPFDQAHNIKPAPHNGSLHILNYEVNASYDPDVFEVIIEDTLYRSTYLTRSKQMRGQSFTPVAGHSKPLSLTCYVEEHEAHDYALHEASGRYSVYSAALQLIVHKLAPQVSHQRDKLVSQQSALDALEEYGMF